MPLESDDTKSRDNKIKELKNTLFKGVHLPVVAGNQRRADANQAEFKGLRRLEGEYAKVNPAVSTALVPEKAGDQRQHEADKEDQLIQLLIEMVRNIRDNKHPHKPQPDEEYLPHDNRDAAVVFI